MQVFWLVTINYWTGFARGLVKWAVLSSKLYARAKPGCKWSVSVDRQTDRLTDWLAGHILNGDDESSDRLFEFAGTWATHFAHFRHLSVSVQSAWLGTWSKVIERGCWWHTLPAGHPSSPPNKQTNKQTSSIYYYGLILAFISRFVY